MVLILIPRARNPFELYQGSRPLASPIFEHAQSTLSVLSANQTSMIGTVQIFSQSGLDPWHSRNELRALGARMDGSMLN